MKLKLLLIPTLILCSLSVPSCAAKEDGDINEWVGEYEFAANYLQNWHHFTDGTKRQIGETQYFKKDTDHFVIYSDKTWKIPDSKDLGPTGKIKCYKDHINLLDFSMDYRIESSYDFKFYQEEGKDRKHIRYHKDGSEGRIRGEYDFTIRYVDFFFLNKI